MFVATTPPSVYAVVNTESISPSKDSTVYVNPPKPPTQPQGLRHRARSSFDSLADLTVPLTSLATVKHVFQQIFLLFHLAIKLWSYLGVGWKWTVNFYRLVLYAVLLLPGFLQIIGFYFLSRRVQRSLPYGRRPRQRLDLYYPASKDPATLYPVVIYITGGAWTIGYKGWGALLAKRLSEHGVLVACLDYRNFPQGNAEQMLEDVNTGISWVCERIGRYGGDPDNITLVGQSAGGQLGALVLLRQAEQAAAGRPVMGAFPIWSPKDIRAFVGVSGAYDLDGLSEHLHKRGLYKNLFAQIMSIDGRPAFRELSPVTAAKHLTVGAADHLPDVLLIHGNNDKSVPHAGSSMLHEALQAANVNSTCCLFEGKTHTSFLIEDPMCGGRDLLTDLILSTVTGNEEEHYYSTLCPKVLCRLAGWICPF